MKNKINTYYVVGMAESKNGRMLLSLLNESKCGLATNCFLADGSTDVPPIQLGDKVTGNIWYMIDSKSAIHKFIYKSIKKGE